MTYLAYSAWILSLVLVVGELDNLIARRLFRRLGLSFPETSWLMAMFLSWILPGLGQFLNGQPLKAAFLMTWPFLTLYGTFVPWALWGLKTGWLLVPWWLIAIGDGLVVGYLRQRKQRAEQLAPRAGGPPDNTVDYYAFLEKKQKRQNSGS